VPQAVATVQIKDEIDRDQRLEKCPRRGKRHHAIRLQERPAHRVGSGQLFDSGDHPAVQGLHAGKDIFQALVEIQCSMGILPMSSMGILPMSSMGILPMCRFFCLL
jgi:hypothetical protein